MHLDEEIKDDAAPSNEAASSDNEPSARSTPRQGEAQDTPREKPKDLRGQLRASIDHHKSPRQAVQQRNREDNGQFSGQQRDNAQPGEARDTRRPTQSEDGSNEGKPPVAQAATASDKTHGAQAPEALSKEIRAAWSTLPENVRNEFIRRETDSSKGVQQLKDRYRPIDESLEPYRPLLRQMGRTEGEAIKQLFDWHGALSGPNKGEAFKALAKSHGIDIATLAGGQPVVSQQEQNPQQQQQPERNPHYERLASEVGDLKTHFQRQQEERVSQELATFAKDKPHFEAVRRTMGVLLNSGEATDLTDAYNKAIWAHPDTRAKIQQEAEDKRAAEAAEAAEKQRADAAKAEEERKRKDDADREKARKANVSPRGTSPSGPVSAHRPVGKSVGSTLRDAIRQSTGSV